MDLTTAKIRRYNLLMTETDAAYHEAALRLGLSDSAMLILYTICDHGEECPLSEILRAGVSKQTINSALRKLESEGIVYLEIISGRRKKVCLTEKGKTLTQNAVRRVIRMENEIFDTWSEQEWIQYLSLTRRYLDAFKEKIKEL